MEKNAVFSGVMALGLLCFLMLPVAPYLPHASAAEPYSYGGSKGGKYGEKREIGSREEAESLLKDQYSKQDVRIGTITEKERYFEAEILDSRGAVVDTVIIDKRTGRIRSIY